PIVARPELAEVPEDARVELRRLVGRYGLVACISGRTGADAYRLVGVDGIAYVGVHGLELAPDAEAWRAPLRAFADVDWPWGEVAVRIAVASPESPAGLREAADVVVASPVELVEILRVL